MKKILSFMVMLLMAMTMQAQEQNEIQEKVIKEKIIQEHLKFMGIPLDGTLQEFKAKLEANGYSIAYTDENSIGYKAKFAGKDAIVYVNSSKYTGKVYSSYVIFEEINNWMTLNNQYDAMVQAYAKKYGKPASVMRKFEYPYEEGDNLELYAIKADKAKIGCMFVVEDGNIMIVIDSHCQINIVYTDDINSKEDKEKEKQSIQDQI